MTVRIYLNSNNFWNIQQNIEDLWCCEMEFPNEGSELVLSRF